MKRIFVIGFSRSGKTTTANQIMDILADSKLIEASNWIREKTRIWGHSDIEISELTRISENILRDNPDIANKHILSSVEKVEEKGSIAIIAGIRNERDFSALYREGDAIFYMESIAYAKTNFEREGVQKIFDLAKEKKEFIFYDPFRGHKYLKNCLQRSGIIE